MIPKEILALVVGLLAGGAMADVVYAGVSFAEGNLSSAITSVLLGGVLWCIGLHFEKDLGILPHVLTGEKKRK